VADIGREEFPAREATEHSATKYNRGRDAAGEMAAAI